jgi:hypothetical protein
MIWNAGQLPMAWTEMARAWSTRSPQGSGVWYAHQPFISVRYTVAPLESASALVLGCSRSRMVTMSSGRLASCGMLIVIPLVMMRARSGALAWLPSSFWKRGVPFGK